MPDDSPKKFSPVFFAFALFCFLLPFVTISCPGGQASFSGYQLVVGTEVQGEEVSGNVLAGVAFVLALAGFAISFAKEQEGLIGAAVVGAAAAILLLFLQSNLTKDVAEETGGLATVSFEIGYWLAVIALAGGAAFSVYLQSRVASIKSSQGSTIAEAQSTNPAVEGTASPAAEPGGSAGG